MKSKEYLHEIRRAEGLRRAVLKKIEIKGSTATFFLATDLNYTDDDVAYARAVSRRFLDEALTAEVKIGKFVPSPEGIRAALLEILSSRYPAAAAFIRPEDVEVESDGAGGQYYISVDAEEEAFADKIRLIEKLSSELERSYSGSWRGEFRRRSKDKTVDEEMSLPPEELVLSPRYFPVTEFAEIDGKQPETAIYMADLNDEVTGVTVCGTVSYIEERQTKKEKPRPYFTIALADKTGKIRVSYFAKKATLEKVRQIKVGDSIFLTGDNELFNGAFSFRAKEIGYGRPPVGFVPEARPSRPVPNRYRTVFPVPISDLKQVHLFEEEAPLPAELTSREFVVFDLETTGLNHTPASGVMDRIIEIGAVKIKDGKICERFSSFVACPVALSAEIVKITGINDSMLVGAPAIGDVIADFYKFTAGCALVGHNVSFDLSFVRYYGEQAGYIFEHKSYDTLSFSQRSLILSNYKLDTVADYFGFNFNHHRAYDDAFVTAKIFIELVRKKGGLPA